MANHELYLNMIIEENEPVDIVKRSIDSVKDYVTGIYVAITYKKDVPNNNHPLKKLLKRYNANVYSYKWTKDFSAARQYIMDQTPHGEDKFILWQDADDVLDGAEHLPKVMENAIAYKQDGIFWRYLYKNTFNPDGSIREILVDQKRERIVRNNYQWKWEAPIHEVLVNQADENINRVGIKEIRTIHKSTNNRIDVGLDRNIEILENAVVKQKYKDPRTLIYLGSSYLDMAKIKKPENREEYLKKALELFYLYLNGAGQPSDANYIAPSGWREERSMCWSYIGEVAILQNNVKIAIEAYRKAAEEGYEFPKHYVDLAMAQVMDGDFKRAKISLMLAMALPDPNTTIVTFPKDTKQRSLQVAFEIHLHEKELEKAEEVAKQLVELVPEDDYFKDTLKSVQQVAMFNKVCTSYVYIGKYLEGLKDKQALEKLVASFPPDVQKERFAAEMRHKFLAPKVWGKDEIAILCGPGWEEWGPSSTEKGIGGSEEAVIQLSKELANKGWKVTVYASPGADRGLHDGVDYKDWYELNAKDEFNVLILWRAIGFVDLNPKSKFTMLWLHDVPNNNDFTKERLFKIDKIAVLSEYHKSLLRMVDKGQVKPIPDSQVFVTANGIPDMDKFAWNGKENSIAYVSSPDRGLVYLLKNWKAIHTAVPDSELNIYYGFNTFDILHKNNPAMQKWKEGVMALMDQPGIKYHGRVSHTKLHEELSKSDIWAYPTDFQEISCISAMKAEALGAIPVVTNYAALKETIKNGYKIDVNIKTEDGQKEYVEALVKIMKDSQGKLDKRKTMIPFARDYFKWSKVANDWDALFKLSVNS